MFVIRFFLAFTVTSNLIHFYHSKVFILPRVEGSRAEKKGSYSLKKSWSLIVARRWKTEIRAEKIYASWQNFARLFTSATFLYLCYVFYFNLTLPQEGQDERELVRTRHWAFKCQNVVCLRNNVRTHFCSCQLFLTIGNVRKVFS